MELYGTEEQYIKHIKGSLWFWVILCPYDLKYEMSTDLFLRVEDIYGNSVSKS